LAGRKDDGFFHVAPDCPRNAAEIWRKRSGRRTDASTGGALLLMMVDEGAIRT